MRKKFFMEQIKLGWIFVLGLFVTVSASDYSSSCSSSTEQQIRGEQYSKMLLEVNDPIELDAKIRYKSHKAIIPYVTLSFETKNGLESAFFRVLRHGGRWYIATLKHSSLARNKNKEIPFSATLLQALDERYGQNYSYAERYKGILSLLEEPNMREVLWRSMNHQTRHEMVYATSSLAPYKAGIEVIRQPSSLRYNFIYY